MQWSGAVNAGFSSDSVIPWLPLHLDHTTRNVEDMRADPDSLYNFYRALIALRKSHPALREGLFNPVTFGTRFIMAYLRQTKEETILVALNFSRLRQRLVLGGELTRGSFGLLLSSARAEVPQIQNGILTLEPFEAMILSI